MRTKSLVLGAALLAAATTASIAQNIYSLNVVGYTTTNLAAPGYTLIANPLDSGNNVFSNFFQGLPSGAQILKWNPVTSAFTPASRVAILNGWSPTSAATNSFAPGEACFIKLTGSTVITQTFWGTVLQTNWSTSFPVGYSMLGSPVPRGGPIAATGTAGLGITNIPTSSQVLKWNPTTQQYTPYAKTTVLTGWNPAATNGPTINVGEGFFVKAQSAFTYTNSFIVQ